MDDLITIAAKHKGSKITVRVTPEFVKDGFANMEAARDFIFGENTKVLENNNDA